MCLMEAVAFLSGEKHSDHPECACPVLAAYARALNDRMGTGKQGDALRAKYLAPLAAKLVETRSTPEVERRRAYFFADRAVRLFAATALKSGGLTDEAASLRGLPEIVDEKTARDASWAADAAVASARDAAWVAAVAADAAAAAAAAATAATAAARADATAWEQAAQVLAEACEIEGGE